MSKTGPFLLPVFRSALFIFAGLLLVQLSGQSLIEASQWWSILCTACNLVTIAVLALVCRKEGTTFRSLLGFDKDPSTWRHTLKMVGLMLLLGIGGMYGFGFLIYGYIPVVMVQPIPVPLAALNLLLLPLTIVLAEFPLYFGYSLNGIDRITGNKWLAIGYPMFFYALQHSFIPLLFEGQHILFRFLSFLPLLFVLGLLYYKERRLRSLMMGHAVLDLATGAQILMTSLFPAVYLLMKSAGER
ncbi:MAG TPA: hypothetical protein VLN47_02255 [Clostridiaceae bacterium]|nr:hypothetical protein [Clostridiaceae bacterium]